jgi:hypothetical protein
MYAQSSFPSRKEPKTTKDEIRLTGTDGVVNQQQRDSTPLLPRSTNREIQPLYYLARPSKAALVSPFVASSLLPGLTDRLLAVRRICRFLLVVFGSRCGFLQHSKERSIIAFWSSESRLFTVERVESSLWQLPAERNTGN